MLDELRFNNLMQYFRVAAGISSHFADLNSAYAEPQRFYHTAAHIEDCLLQFDCVRSEATRPEEIEAAIWFHDVVYDPRASDNEEQSANWAKRVLHRGGVPDSECESVTNLILLTRHDQPATTRDGELLLDIDLSILGQESEAFREYDKRIRREYAWVPEERYRAARAEILEGFLLRPFLYHTVTFRDRFETKARKNLANTIAALRSS